MLTVDDYGASRRARRDGRSIRQIAREFDHARNTIRKVLKHPEPNPSTRNRFAPKLGTFHGIIDLGGTSQTSIKRRCRLSRFQVLGPPPGYNWLDTDRSAAEPRKTKRHPLGNLER